MEATDNRSKLKVNMLTLLTSREGKSPVYLARYIRFLMRNGELGDAQGWQKQLETVAPGSNESLEIKARILHAQGAKEEQAASLLKDFAAAKEENVAFAGRSHMGEACLDFNKGRVRCRRRGTFTASGS